MNRRDFLKSGLLTMAGLNALDIRAAGVRSPHWGRTLLLVELNGGNDGLNTVIPYSDPLYQELRPKIAIKRDQVLQLSGQLGLHPAMDALMSHWEKSELAVVNGVGYPDPNRSHFRSIDIWDTASGSEEVLQAGWVARAFAANNPPASLTADSIVIGRNSAPVSGAGIRNISMRSARNFVREARKLSAINQQATNAALSHLLAVQGDIRRAATDLEQRLEQAGEFTVAFPKNRFGRDLETAARLLASGVRVPVIKVALGSFDTHANQAGTHRRLLTELSTGLSAFQEAMQAGGLWDQLLVMTYSEFGRRAAENGSRGTDHGTAAPHLLMGGRVNGGFYGKQPALYDLENKDLKYSTDYRELYSSVLHDWWGISELPGYTPLRGLIA